MRYLGILLIGCPLLALAQPADDSRTLQTLLGEVRELRLAIERSTLLGARTQLAISQLQLQEARATRLAQEHNAAREVLNSFTAQKNRTTIAIRELESKPPTPGDGRDAQLKQMKAELESVIAAEPRFAARESEVAAQLQAAQRDAQDSRNWISEMQRSLDNAIQQMLKPRQ